MSIILTEREKALIVSGLFYDAVKSISGRKAGNLREANEAAEAFRDSIRPKKRSLMDAVMAIPVQPISDASLAEQYELLILAAGRLGLTEAAHQLHASMNVT